MIAEANDGCSLDGFSDSRLFCLEGATMGASGSMPQVDEFIMTVDYLTGTAVLDSTTNRAICEDVDVRWGRDARV